MQGSYTADFLFNVEKRAVAFNEYNYNKLTRDLWYQRITKDRNFDTKSERLTWLFETAGVDQLSPQDGGENGGQLSFDELATITTEYFPAFYGRGFKMSRIRWENFVNGSNGLDPLTSWAGGVGKYGAYVPQRQVAQLLLNGANVLGYDGVDFFATTHPTHPTISGYGTYANVFTSTASGVYPGAVPIDDSVSLETALTNLSKVLSYIRTAVLQPNGMGDPRRLVPKYLIHPVRMTPRVNLLLEAAYLPLSANSGGGSAELRSFYQRQPAKLEAIEAPEIGAAITYTVPFGAATGLSTSVSGSDTTYYIACEEATDSELGSLVMSIRKPFAMSTFAGEGGGMALDAILSRSGDIESHYKGWYGFNYGHPYGIYQCKAA